MKLKYFASLLLAGSILSTSIGAMDHSTTPSDLTLEQREKTQDVLKLYATASGREEYRPESIDVLINLTHLDLSRNQLSGNIPATIGTLTGLVKLSLEGNQLSEVIPNDIKRLAALGILKIRL